MGTPALPKRLYWLPNYGWYEKREDIDLLAPLVVANKSEFDTAGLDMVVFNLDDRPAVEAIPKVNELLYDVLLHMVARGSVANSLLLGSGD
ncbi:hypothetical protein CYMTET_10801 [Cymbomonas tetramitiformis]|uniref:Uncharacterized protein n=1 Tax=Cymbomonas tetramitiformis TaxID=36881 RepID=A0AAE0GP17_9CHLO|nr:hypothetical protein CYMTET_10801 [Cymbomonas tetramitiformis]